MRDRMERKNGEKEWRESAASREKHQAQTAIEGEVCPPVMKNLTTLGSLLVTFKVQQREEKNYRILLSLANKLLRMT